MLALLVLLTGCRPAAGMGAALENFSYSHSGMSADSIYTYSLRRENDGYLADFDLYGQFCIENVPVDAADAAELERLIGAQGLWAWNGFSGSNDFLLDGESFSLYAAFADGDVLTAHGNNAFPEGYSDGASAIRGVFERIMEKNQIDPWKDE